jgi:hypothetical protein
MRETISISVHNFQLVLCETMRFTKFVLASAILFASLDDATAVTEKGKRANTLFKDDQSYWESLLVRKGYSVGSLPTPPPTPRPYLPPTHDPYQRPHSPPTPAPTPGYAPIPEGNHLPCFIMVSSPRCTETMTVHLFNIILTDSKYDY